MSAAGRALRAGVLPGMALALALGASPRPAPPEPIPDRHAAETATEGQASRRPATVTRPVACAALPNVPGKSITTVIVDMPPLAFTPAHRHPGSVAAVVLSGTVRSRLNGGPIVDYRAGQAWFEPPGTLHDFAENPSATEAAALLAIFVADTDCGPLVVFE